MSNTDFENLREHAKRGDYTNAHLARRVQELEAALDAAQDDAATAQSALAVCMKRVAQAEADAARLRAVIEQVEWGADNTPYWSGCMWCKTPYPNHAPDCQRQAALAQTQEVKA